MNRTAYFRLRIGKFLAAMLLVCEAQLVRSANFPARAPYQEVAESLTTFIRAEMAEKQIAAVSIALIDDQQIVWSAGFGNARTNVTATADTIYRVGSVSKLFTDIALMQLVEKGELDLDAPVTRYLSSFQPTNRFEKPITIRQLMTHRSGLGRETPVGSYFDPTEPSVAETIASLNRTEVVYEPGTRTKYSNAAIALVGYLLELKRTKPFTDCIQELLEPLGLRESSFRRTPKISVNLADGWMWTLHGRSFKAPEFELGIAPAACMYSSVNDLARFMFVLFNREGEIGRKILRPETWNQMLTIQFAQPDQKSGFGLGFSIRQIEGHRAAGHNGAMYGFATQFTGLIDDKLGAVVIASKDFVNSITDRIASKALRGMLATKNNAVAPKNRELAEKTDRPSEAPDLATLKTLPGRYAAADGRAVTLRKSGTNLLLLPSTGGYQQSIRLQGDKMISDGPFGYGQVLELEKPGAQTIRFDGTVFTRTNEAPHAIRKEWQDLIGEYGWDHDILYILERDGKLWALIEWFEFNPLEEVSKDVFAFPQRGLYNGEKLVFKRDEFNFVTEVVAANVPFKSRSYAGRRKVGPATRQFHIQPVRPIAEIRKAALALTPPRETNQFRAPNLVEITNNLPGLKLDIRYASENNFLGTPFYSQARAFLQRPAAEALFRAQRKLNARGLGIIVFDGYRPWYVTKTFWDATPEEHKWLVADPTKGSRHNRGCAIDLTLLDLSTGEPIEMTGTYDEPTDRSYPDYPGGTSSQRYYRDLLREVMESEGFTVYPEEWWHFDYNDWREFPIMNISFENLGAPTR